MPPANQASACPDPLGSPTLLSTSIDLPVCHVRQIGRVPYDEARQLQENLALQIAAGEIPPTLLLLEHPHTYTLGRRGQVKNLLWDEATCRQQGVSVCWTDRGGDITYHGPGQLVGYPLLPLGRPVLQSASSRLPQADYIGYLRKLEDVLILTLQKFEVEGLRVQGKTGVWVKINNRVEKIASIGVKVDAQGITRHGFALNISPEMLFWHGIIACGLDNDQMTSLAALLPSPPAIQQVSQAVIAAFRERFHYHMVKYP
jgi:lipoyl(octanoyl) transferase